MSRAERVADPPPTRQNLIWVMPAEGDVTDQMCLVLAGGDAVLPIDPVPHPAFVIAADGGLEVAERLGVDVDLVIGDLDSADPEAVRRVRTAGATVEEHPEDKDATDLELALNAAADRGFPWVIVIGGTAPGRLDHLLANAGLLASDRYAGIKLEWRIGATRVLPLHDTLTVEGETGDIVSIIPIAGTATVSAGGLEWPLTDEILDPHSSRSVSNRLTGRTAEISVSSGHALVVHTRGTP